VALLELTIGNTFDELTAASARVAEWLEIHDVPPAASTVAALGIEELVTNCIKYGYDDEAAHTIQVSVSFTHARLTVTIVDDGRPFDPVAAAPPDLTLSLDERVPGGLGLHLLRSLADTWTYERRDARNVVTLHKTCAPP
jgi:anti-sigma regulatory factor (Ser/Thr protein kinase)